MFRKNCSTDMEQRNGRIERQGNENPEVQIYRYVTDKTFDAYLYQMLENKQRFISQIMTSKTPERVCSDIDEQAQKMYDELVQTFAKEEGCTEQLKATDQMLWVRKMNNAAQRAREVINAEMIYNQGLF